MECDFLKGEIRVRSDGRGELVREVYGNFTCL